MPPEAAPALLAMLQDKAGPRMAAAFALAQLGDKLPPEMQRSLITLLHEPQLNSQLRIPVCLTLGVSGIHPASDALLVDVLSLAHSGLDDTDLLRSYFYLWFGRSPALLQAVRWLGHQDEDPPLGDTPPQEILNLIARLWPHSAKHTELRHEMVRRTSQILTAQVKTLPLDAATQTVLRTLAVQLAADPAPDCVAALQQVQAALAAGEKK